MEMIHEAGQYVDTVKRVCDAVGGEVTFRGTVHRVRDMSDFAFVIMRVERGLIQCTFQGDEISGIKRDDIAHLAHTAEREANPLYPVPKLMTEHELAALYEEIADWNE